MLSSIVLLYCTNSNGKIYSNITRIYYLYYDWNNRNFKVVFSFSNMLQQIRKIFDFKQTRKEKQKE